MKVVKTAKLKITDRNKILQDTLNIYNQALTFLIAVCEQEYYNLQGLRSKENMNAIERMVHKTLANPEPKYGKFDELFYKFPSYLRRCAIMEAIGIVDSHFSRYRLWQQRKEQKEEKNKRFLEKPPKLQYEHKSFPVLYKQGMFKKTEEGKAQIKCYINKDWKWLEVNYDRSALFSGKDFRFENYKEHNPALVKKGKKFFLHIPYEDSVKLNDIPLEKQKAVAVDLGLTNSAVCSCVESDGTVTDRLFINQPVEKDRLNTAVNRLSKAKRISGILNSKPNKWRVINNLQQSIVQDTVDRIVDFALKNNAAVIVFEHLGKMKSPRGIWGAKKLRAKLQFWAKRKIQEKTKEKAWSKGIRNSKVVARGTSKYAFDGSGEVTRSSKGDIAQFLNGKYYHADLSASYNIGARYFIRAKQKTLSETVRLQAEAKDPLLADRTTQTLSSLIRLSEVCGYAANASSPRIYDREAPSIALL